MRLYDNHTNSALRNWTQLMIGLLVFGVAVSLMIKSGLGLGPWDAFHVGLHNLTGLSIGMASILVGLIVVLGTSIKGIRPGPATVLNMVLIGIYIDVMLPWTPPAHSWYMGLLYYAIALGLFGFATGMYIGAGLGSGPRDGMMVAISEGTGWSVRRVRTLMEMVVLFFGWLMGGKIGLGTVLFTLAIGPATQWGMNLFGLTTSGKRGSEELRQAA